MISSADAVACWVGAEDPRWNALLVRANNGSLDPMLGSAYHALHEIAGDGIAEAFGAAEALFVPGLRVAIAGTDLADLQSCNGYGGPVASAAEQGILADVWSEWRRSARDRGIVAGFFRMNPLLHNRAALPRDAEIRADRNVVSVDLSHGSEAAWTRVTTRHRNMVNRSRRERVRIQWDTEEDWREFPAVYDDAMARLDAPARLRYGAAYFDALRAVPHARLAAFRDADGIVAAAVFLIGERHAYYHVAARRAGAPNYSGNAILQAGIERCAEAGATALLLGGGATPSPSDPLLAFKRSIGTDLLTFETARVIADDRAFRSLCAQQPGTGRGWLLPYREPARQS